MQALSFNHTASKPYNPAANSHVNFGLSRRGLFSTVLGLGAGAGVIAVGIHPPTREAATELFEKTKDQTIQLIHDSILSNPQIRMMARAINLLNRGLSQVGRILNVVVDAFNNVIAFKLPVIDLSIQSMLNLNLLGRFPEKLPLIDIPEQPDEK